MKTIEHSYLNNLVQKARQGSSNAFAELTASVYRRHYSYLKLMLQEEDKVIPCLKMVYIQILHNLSFIGSTELYMPWSCRICYHVCEDILALQNSGSRIRTPAGPVTLQQLNTLPLAESQIMIMRYQQKLSVKTIGYLLNLESNVVRRCISAGVRHLKKAPGDFPESTEEQKSHSPGAFADSEGSASSGSGRRGRKRKPDVIVIQEILDEVFDASGQKPNSVPVEALVAYSVYRKERFSLQKGILIAAMILFLLLPVLFIPPAFEFYEIPMGERGLPVVTIAVEPRLPVRKVLAEINWRSLPVYEAGAFEYTIEPTRNGTLTVEVELINRQSLKKDYEMEDVDSEGPELLDNIIEEDCVRLVVEDQGIGIDYREIYAQDLEGNRYDPISCNEETGEIVFAYPDTQWEVYIPDHLGNRLHLSFVFE